MSLFATEKTSNQYKNKKGRVTVRGLTLVKEGKAVTTSRQVAENFGKEHKHVLDSIRDILGVAENSADPMFHEITYIHPQNKQEYPEFLINRDGFTLLAMGFTGSDAMQWKIKYIQAFNEMEKQLTKPLPQMSQMEIIAAIAQGAAEHEKQLKQISAAQTKQAEEIQGIRDVISLDVTSWRTDSKNLLVKMAQKSGNIGLISDLYKDVYKLLDARMGVNIKQRLTNLRNRLMNEGVCKSKRDKANQLDVIGEDKKLIEGFVAIVKEMAIKAGVA